MINDAIFVGIAVVWIFLNFLSGDNGQAIVWFGVLIYSVLNFSENRLKGSKHDY